MYSDKLLRYRSNCPEQFPEQVVSAPEQLLDCTTAPSVSLLVSLGPRHSAHDSAAHMERQCKRALAESSPGRSHLLDETRSDTRSPSARTFLPGGFQGALQGALFAPWGQNPPGVPLNPPQASAMPPGRPEMPPAQDLIRGPLQSDKKCPLASPWSEAEARGGIFFRIADFQCAAPMS